MTKVVYTPIIDGNKSVFLYKSNIFDDTLKDNLTRFVKEQTYRDGRCVSGREIPRKQLWFQKDGKYFCDSWKNRYDRWVSVKEYPDILEQVAKRIYDCDEITNTLKEHGITLPDINSCLINKYRDGNDSIRAHRDTYLSFGDFPVIIGISLGDSRILRVRRLHYPELFKSMKVQKDSDEHIDFLLEDNSIFVMAGYSQKYFSHEIPKMEDKECRYSLTFREFI
jgi:alkylated DNA repair dioxygenase AlkB